MNKVFVNVKTGLLVLCVLFLLSSCRLCGIYTYNCAIEDPSLYGNTYMIHGEFTYYVEHILINGNNEIIGFNAIGLSRVEREAVKRNADHRVIAAFKDKDGSLWKVRSGPFKAPDVKLILLCNDGKVRVIKRDNSIISPDEKPVYMGNAKKNKNKFKWIFADS